MSLVESEPERLYTGAVWLEGPVWLPGERVLRMSDIPNDRILEYSEATGVTRVYAGAVEFTNGMTLDREGRVVRCSHGRRRVEREDAGDVVPIVDRFGAARLNSPNDVVVASDGAIWFTDPPYGIHSDVEGHRADPEYGGCHVFRYDESSGELTAVVTDVVHPNGLAFSPDESILYVSDTSALVDPDGHHHIRAYDIGDGACRDGRVLAEISPGVSDGFRVDREGRIWTSSESGVQVLNPGGDVIERIPLPEKVSNVCFGGDGHDLYITASTSLYRVRTRTAGAGRKESRA